MPNVPLYPNAKPVDGDVLLLCEGDTIGYESQLLKAWADAADLGGRFVKVLACGTAEALFGVADAIGRTVPIIVIEDRDFRTVDEAEQECRKKLQNREGRNVAMRAWIAWKRAEIENYFTDASVLLPVFADVFACSEQNVEAAVAKAVATLPVTQALEYSLYRARREWNTTDANRALRVESMRWQTGSAQFLTADEVRAKLEKRLDQWPDREKDGPSFNALMTGKKVLADFDEKVTAWSGLTYGDDVWRQDWACKEVLKFVRMTLCASGPGWWSTGAKPKEAVDWAAFNDDKARDEHDRRVERTIQPSLVARVVDRLAVGAPVDLHEELDQLAKRVRT